MDGTIVDTEKIWVDTTRLLIERKGVPYTTELHAQLQKEIHGLAIHKSCRVIKDLISLDDHIDDLIQEKSQIACSLYKQGNIRFIEGFTDFHGTLANFDLKHGIATNADDITVRLTNEALNLTSFFGKHIYGISAVNNICKPDPAIYLHVAQQLGVNPQECIAIEDSAHGIKSAKSAGMYCIGINTSKKPEQTKEAHKVIDEYHQIDLPKLLKK